MTSFQSEMPSSYLPTGMQIALGSPAARLLNWAKKNIRSAVQIAQLGGMSARLGASKTLSKDSRANVYRHWIVKFGTIRASCRLLLRSNSSGCAQATGLPQSTLSTHVLYIAWVFLWHAWVAHTQGTNTQKSGTRFVPLEYPKYGILAGQRGVCCFVVRLLETGYKA